MQVDPYILGVIRLADRRGLLTGDLSPIQEWMLQILMLWELKQDAQRIEDETFNQVRAAMLIVNPFGFDIQHWMRNLYPEFYRKPATEETVVVEEVTEEDLEDSTGGWDFKYSETTPEEIEEVLRGLGQMGKLTLDDLDASADDGWV
jgi:hypothetical protein